MSPIPDKVFYSPATNTSTSQSTGQHPLPNEPSGGPDATAHTTNNFELTNISPNLSASNGTTMAAAKGKGSVKIRDSIVAWDPDAATLLKAVDNLDLDALQELLANGAHINSHAGVFHETALHRAAQIGWADGVQYLVSNGASVYAKNQFGQIPLHYAAKSKSPACVKLLLEVNRLGALDHRDMRGHTPLHDASGSGCVEAVKLLLKAGALVSSRDGNGETPLYKAAKAPCVESIVVLLNAGADLTAVDNNGESVLSYILHHLPGTIADIFDSCLITNSPKLTAKTLEVTMNFLPLTGPFEKNQIQNLQSFVNNSHAKILTHPLCETFLHLKWMNVRKLFLIEVIFYLMYAVLTTLLVFNKIVWTTDSGNITELTDKRGGHWKEWGEAHLPRYSEENPPPEGIKPFDDKDEVVVKGIVLFQTALILFQQFLSILQNKLSWFNSISGVFHVIITLLVIAVVSTSVPEEWQHHMASLLLLLMWTECMLLIGRFPNCGIYVVMFARVAKVFLKIFAIYFCLLLAFSSAFYVILHSKDAEASIIFAHPLLTFMKTLTMMIGEVDFADEQVQGFSHLWLTGPIIFLLFFVLVSIILSNLLVALAVNDVQGLRNSAHLERLTKQTELVFQMERNFATAAYLAKHIKIPKVKAQLMKIASVCKHDCQNIRVFVKPNNPKKANMLHCIKNRHHQESKISSQLLGHIMDCLRNREPKDKFDSRSTTRFKRGSRLRSSEYGRGNDTMDISSNLKELEASVIDTINEKIEDVSESLALVDHRMSSIEEKLAKLTDLLLGNTTQSLTLQSDSDSENEQEDKLV